MNLNVSTGHWMRFFLNQMQSHSESSICFILPSYAHLHAFLIAQKSFPQGNFTFKIEEQVN